MLCQSCLKNMATTNIKTIVNGEFKEYMLCPSCAKELGYMNLFDDFVSDFSNFWGSFVSDPYENNLLPKTKRCDFCGSSFSDIISSGKVGCAHCYEAFHSELLPTIQRIHGSTSHKGKLSSHESPEAKTQNEIKELRLKLEKAIKNEEFEEAAKLRDKIKEMEGESKNV